MISPGGLMRVDFFSAVAALCWSGAGDGERGREGDAGTDGRGDGVMASGKVKLKMRLGAGPSFSDSDFGCSTPWDND